MLIIGCDYHPSFQQIAFVDAETGEFQEQRLSHREEAERFYRDLAAQGRKSHVGMEASGHARWFERLLAELKVELWRGVAAKIQAKRVRKTKTDREDARHILQLMLKDDFPQIWVPSWDNRDLRQLLWHRHRMVQMRTRIMNQLQAVALNEGLRCKKRLWGERGRQQLESIGLAPWASRRRRDLLELLDRLTPTISELTQQIEQEVEKYPAAQRLMTRSGCVDGPGLRADLRRAGAVAPQFFMSNESEARVPHRYPQAVFKMTEAVTCTKCKHQHLLEPPSLEMSVADLESVKVSAAVAQRCWTTLVRRNS